MKKFLLMFALMITANFSFGATVEKFYEFPFPPYPLLKIQSTPLQIALWPVSLVPAGYDADVFGVNLNLLNLYHFHTKVYGLSCGLTQYSNYHYGVSAALLHAGYSKHYGITLGVINLLIGNCGISAGVLNIAEDTRESLPVNSGKLPPKAPNILQIGVLNYANEGVQVGLFNNITKAESQGIAFQLGLLNHNPDAIIPWMPLFNFNF